MKVRRIELAAVVGTAILIVGALIVHPMTDRRIHDTGGPGWDHLRCAIQIGGPVRTSEGLVYGYYYHLLREYAASTGVPVRIVLAREGESWTDSLVRGRVDIVAVPFRDSAFYDGILVSRPLDSLCLWLVKKNGGEPVSRINKWIKSLEKEGFFASEHPRFMRPYNPYKRRSNTGFISPYDSIFRAWGDKIGWDWRLLAAIAYQESHFRIDVRSAKGAEGIMQIMPRTGQRYGVEDLVDPSGNIKAGAMLLKELSRLYRESAADRQEWLKFVLASYNAGAARVKTYMKYATMNGVDVSRWDDVADILPQMKCDSLYLADSAGLSRINYQETVHYVRRVLSLYGEFKRISPTSAELSAPDPLPTQTDTAAM